MNFIYAVSGCPVLSAEVLKDAGLYGIIKDPAKITQRGSEIGPAGGKCILFWAEGPADKLVFKPELQVWNKSNNGKFQIGYYTDSPPTEKELARKDQIDGHFVENEDGQKWRIPMARIFPAGTRLPETLLLGPDNKVYTKPIAKYAEFSRRAEVLWEDFKKQLGWVEGEQELDYSDEMLLVIEALSFNYHVGVDEINAMELLNTKNFEKIIHAIVDVPTLNTKLKEMSPGKKKTSPVTSSAD